MIIRVLNCNYQNRPNQNTTISINKRELGFQLSDIVSEDFGSINVINYDIYLIPFVIWRPNLSHIE